MIRFSVSYPSGDGKSFDHDYYAATHVPLVIDVTQPVKVEIDRGVNGPHVAAAHFYFESMSTFREAMKNPRFAEVLADVSNYTDIEPVSQVSEIVG